MSQGKMSQGNESCYSGLLRMRAADALRLAEPDRFLWVLGLVQSNIS